MLGRQKTASWKKEGVEGKRKKVEELLRAVGF
jgi:hypothetical protein